MKKIVCVSANWCSPCKQFKPILQKVTSELNVSVEHVDADYDTFYIQQFSIQSVPTTMLFKDGNMMWKRSGVIQESELRSLISQ